MQIQDVEENLTELKLKNECTTPNVQVILDPSTTSNAELDAYGRSARVKIDDKDSWNKGKIVPTFTQFRLPS